MPAVVYEGPSNYREISASDWKSVGVTDQGKVRWGRDEGNSQDLSDAAWDWIQRVDSTPKGEHRYRVVPSSDSAPMNEEEPQR